MKSRLNKLYADNRQASARKFEVVAKADSSEVDIFLYDHIVSSEEEAEWWGGVAPESFVKAVYAVDKNATINLRVNSPGGSVFAAAPWSKHCAPTKARWWCISTVSRRVRPRLLRWPVTKSLCPRVPCS